MFIQLPLCFTNCSTSWLDWGLQGNMRGGLNVKWTFQTRPKPVHTQHPTIPCDHRCDLKWFKRHLHLQNTVGSKTAFKTVYLYMNNAKIFSPREKYCREQKARLKWVKLTIINVIGGWKERVLRTPERCEAARLPCRKENKWGAGGTCTVHPCREIFIRQHFDQLICIRSWWRSVDLEKSLALHQLPRWQESAAVQKLQHLHTCSEGNAPFKLVAFIRVIRKHVATEKGAVAVDQWIL